MNVLKIKSRRPFGRYLLNSRLIISTGRKFPVVGHMHTSQNLAFTMSGGWGSVLKWTLAQGIGEADDDRAPMSEEVSANMISGLLYIDFQLTPFFSSFPFSPLTLSSF